MAFYLTVQEGVTHLNLSKQFDTGRLVFFGSAEMQLYACLILTGAGIEE